MSTATVRMDAAGAARPRLAFVDSIRWVVIAMVVLVHACVTYSGLGSWYYKEPAELDMASTLAFYAYQMFSQAFFMGLLFFVAAAFTPGAYERKGLGRFVLDRLVRLGIPTLVYMLVLHPATIAILAAGTGHDFGPSGLAGWYLGFVTSGEFLGESGPLWFAFALLAFSLLYGVVRRLAEGRSPRPVTPVALTPSTVNRAGAGLVALIAAAAFLVRLAAPLGTSVLNMQLCYFPQYVALFCAGLWAGRRGVLAALPRASGRTWLVLAACVGVPGWLLVLGLGGAMSGNQAAYMGGLHWQAAALAAWEAFVCVALSLGLLVAFRERANGGGRVAGLLSRTSFGIYVFHAPVLVAVTILLQGVAIYPLGKALVAGGIAWTASFLVAAAIRRVPGVAKIFA